MNTFLEGSHSCMSQNSILQVLQGWPAKLDVLVCELLVNYTCGVAALRDPDISQHNTSSVLQAIEMSLKKVSDFLEVDTTSCDDSPVDRIPSMLLSCLDEAKDDMFLLLGMLSVFCATCMASDNQHTKAQELLRRLLLKLQNTKELHHTSSLSVCYNNTKYRLLVSSECNSSSADIVSLSHLVHILLAYLCLSQDDHDACNKHLNEMARSSSFINNAPHLIYMKAFTHMKKSDITAADTTVNHWRQHAGQSVDLSPPLWNICACLCGEKGKPKTAIQMCKEALKLDFDFVLAIYNIAQYYRVLGLHDIELETLNLLVTTLEQSTTVRTKHHMTVVKQRCPPLNNRLCIMGPGIGICDADNQPMVSLEQALYSLCKRCLDLKRYEIARQKYLDLLALLTDHNRPSAATPAYITLPPVAQIFLECAQCMLYSRQYEASISVCDRVIQRSQGDDQKLINNVTDSRSICDDSKIAVDKTCRGRKRCLSDENTLQDHDSAQTVSISVLVHMCRADAHIMLGLAEEAEQSLNSVIWNLEADITQELKPDKLPEESAEYNIHVTKKARLDSGVSSRVSSSGPVVGPASRTIRNILTKAYSKKSILLLGLCRHQEALTNSRLAVITSNDDVTAVYNQCLMLLKLGREQEAYATWLKHRNIATPMDPFQAENLLKRKRASFECLHCQPEHLDEAVLQNKLNQQDQLNMDILSLSHMRKNKYYKH